MKTKTSLITGLIVALLFRTAWSLPGPDDYKKLQEEVKNATVTPTFWASAQTLQIPAGQNATTDRVFWNVGSGRPIIVLRVNVNGGGETDLATLPTVSGPGSINSRPTGDLVVTVKAGTNIFSLYQGGQRLASVTVTGKTSSPTTEKTNTSNPAATPSAEAEESSSSNDTDDQHGKHKKNKKNKKKHHHHDDDENQGND